MALRKRVPRPYEIVVPTDFSTGSGRAMAFALALGDGSRVTAVHAVDPFPYRFGPPESSGPKRQQAWVLAQNSMARWLREGKFSGCDSIVIEGDPAPAIVKFAVAKDADLVVLATSARRHAARLMLGSVAEEIFRELNGPLVVFGPKVRLLKKRKLALLVFATDLETHSLAALAQLSKISNRFRSDVTVIRAVSRDVKASGERNWLRQETRERFEAAADRNLRKRTKKIAIAVAPPVKAITNFAHRLGAGAIVMGIRRGGELSRAATHIPWTLVHRVIAEAKCPVITIRG